MTVQRAPDAPEIVVEHAVFPVSGQIVVGAQQEHLVARLVHIEQREADARQNIVGFWPEGQEGGPLIVQIQRCAVPVHIGQRDPFRQFPNIQGTEIFLAVLGQLAGELVGVQMLERGALTHGDIPVQIVHIAVVGIVAAQSRSLGPIGTAHLIDHTIRQRVTDPLGGGQHPCGLSGQMAQIHHVGVALLPGVAAVVLTPGGGPAQFGKEAGILRRSRERLLSKGLVGIQQRFQSGEVGHGQGGLILGAHRLAALVIGVADGGAQRCAVHIRIFRQRPQPAGIEPAVARLHLFGGHQVFGKVLEGGRHIHRGHQAGVEAHQLQRRVFGVCRPYGVKGLIHLGKVQGIQPV